MNHHLKAAFLTASILGPFCLIASGQPIVNQSSKFEAASVRPSPPFGRGAAFTAMEGGPGSKDPGRISYRNILLKNVLSQAYRSSAFAIDGPGWLDEARFDIIATLPSGSTEDQFGLMLQNLLQERFKLVTHREMREAQGYVLLAAKGGPKLMHASESGASGNSNSAAEPWTPSPGPPRLDADGFPLTPPRPGIHPTCIRGRCRMRGVQASTRQLAESLSNKLACPVIDKTEIEGDYDFTLTYDIVSLKERQSSLGYGNGAPEVALALQAQLGLTIQPKKVPASVLVIDHIDKLPNEN